jgi:sphingomyelin phosphodiesterase acid-like 3
LKIRTASLLLKFRFIAILCCIAVAQPKSKAATPKPAAAQAGAQKQVRALFLSDIHFEPFHDPGKAQQLVAAPVSQWKTILASPASYDAPARFASLQQICHARGEDASFPLYESSLQAIKTAVPDAKFITVSGDLISHSFNCKYKILFPQSTHAEYKAFVEKTIEFVLAQLRAALPAAPVYAAFGNNDADCGDYTLNPNSDFLTQTGTSISASFPAALQKETEHTFSAGGYYSAPLPAPLEHTRLLVLDNVFMSKNYAMCSGKPDPSGANAQIAWLKQQLAEARERKEKVWVMGHIPPGVDPYSTARRFRNVCSGAEPEMFLSSDDLANTLAEFGDVIQLALFGHTHMDEMRYLKPAEGAASSRGVAIKLIPSISPVNGNTPSFTVAAIDAPSATLADYQVFAASNLTGVNASWKEEYDYAHAYREPDFSAQSLATLVKGFAADSTASTPASDAYLRDYYVRDRSLELRPFWPEYVCAMADYSIESYKSCRCGGPKP